MAEIVGMNQLLLVAVVILTARVSAAPNTYRPLIPVGSVDFKFEWDTARDSGNSS